MPKYKFSVFTPCYNSEKVLHRVFDSLQSQSCRDFEWIVVNDASTDGTAALIREYQARADFPIEFFDLNENKMVMVSYNMAVAAAQGELFIPAGHDDEFAADALEKFYAAWMSVPAEERTKLCGVFALCQDQQGRLVGDPFPRSPMISNFLDILFRYRVEGEKWMALRSDVLREFPFSTTFRYLPEGLVWYGMAEKYDAIFINEKLRTYYTRQRGIDTLSSSRKLRNVPGHHFGLQEMLNRYSDWIRQNPRAYLHYLVTYIRFSIHLGWGVVRILRGLQRPGGRLFASLVFPAAAALALLDRLRGRIDERTFW